jgi:hypothetical protein
MGDFRRRYRPLWGPDVGGDVDEEFAFHVEERTEALIAAGLDERAAREEAIRGFGDIERVKASCLDLTRARQESMRRRERLGELRRGRRARARHRALADGVRWQSSSGQSLSDEVQRAASFELLYVKEITSSVLDRLLNLLLCNCGHPHRGQLEALEKKVGWKPDGSKDRVQASTRLQTIFHGDAARELEDQYAWKLQHPYELF